jgi:DNA/RNA-binding domain of Phe-tRNA-synthetase-like protein
MYIQHTPEIWRDFPQLVAGVVAAEGIDAGADVRARLGRFERIAAERLAIASEGEFAEIQAWRRAFSRMGLKPTQYRCAAESLLRRYRRERSLPTIHPLIDLCNAISLAFAIPIAVYDRDKIADWIEIRTATGGETFVTFAGEPDPAEPGEIIFADAAGHAHARRWTHRQSGYSAVSAGTTSALLVAEAMHDSATEDIPRLLTTLADEVRATWGSDPRTAILSAASPRFDV